MTDSDSDSDSGSGSGSSSGTGPESGTDRGDHGNTAGSDPDPALGPGSVDVSAFVARSRVLLETSPPTTRRETRTWLVEPFLETLGWDAKGGSTACERDPSLDSLQLEYAFSVDGVPAVFVAVEPATDSLEESRADALADGMRRSGVDRAIYTNGREYLLLAGAGSEIERFGCRLPALPDCASALEHYARSGLATRLERHTRAHVARQLAFDRERLVDAIVGELTANVTGGESHAAEFESAADSFLAELIGAFSDESGVAGSIDTTAGDTLTFDGARGPDSNVPERRHGGDQEQPALDGTGASAVDGDDGPRADSSNSSNSSNSKTRANDGTASSSISGSVPEEQGERERERKTVTDDDDGPEHGDPLEEDGESDDGEYVVKFFNERGSIGAVGHSKSDQALVAAVEYLFDRGLSGISVPWTPTDDGPAVLNDEPARSDGVPMADPRELSNGLYLEVGGEVETRAELARALADRAGLRAMVTGDWG
ncbi:hypothetical protein [Halobiforma nitratireducens]|uniref:Type I restriction enzyme R protein N-terminal domain-containing protein n=1 Tax=Halobiforma nitratireducens JCM 10879 TaxID=1227454 RepID=M0MC81_9EURY|nr:hypothetical protein [Halobiforma nitratireducens]EMA42943.1 hypothetical protein C446_03816 [Halobiforma nitratireducens JCM 10879]